MDTNEKPKRSWWRKKRWWAAIALWVLVAYPVSGGPVAYAAGRGWITPPVPAVEVIYTPLRALPSVLGNRWLQAYYGWLHELGVRHR